MGEFAAAGLLALGTDSRLTSDGDMLDELRAAAGTGQLASEQLFRAVTTDAARLLRIPEAGALLPGSLPDFFVTALPAALDAPYAALPRLTGADIEAVYVGGEPRFSTKQVEVHDPDG